MFSVDLDHLNILVMLILAFFSFKNYRGDTLALEYESEDEEMEVDDKVGEKEESVREVDGEMMAEVEVDVKTIEVVEDMVPCESSLNAHDIEPCQEQEQEALTPLEPQLTLTTQEEKDSDQESTLMNRNNPSESLLINTIEEEQLDNNNDEPLIIDEEEIFSSDNSSSNSSSCCSSSLLGSEVGDELLINGSSRKEKRKLIQKARRKMKKEMKRKEHGHNHLVHSEEVIRLIDFEE